jgi:uncharacterized protein involved in exopolysaccharide biosynthesis
LPETFAAQHDSSCEPETRPRRSVGRPHSSTSLREVGEVLLRRRRLAGAVVGGLLLLCILYCLIAPNQYEASARVALRTGPASALSLEASESPVSASMSSAQMQLETLANVFRSDQLAWRVITDLKLYQEPGFMGRFPCRFPCRLPQFRSAAPDAEAKDWLLERFQRRLHVQSLPRTLLLQIRFRTKDAALSAAVVNGLIRAYGQQESESRVQATIEASG